MHNKKKLLVRFKKKPTIRLSNKVVVQSYYLKGLHFFKYKHLDSSVSCFKECIQRKCMGLSPEERSHVYCGLYNMTKNESYFERCYQDGEAFKKCSDDVQAKIHFNLGYACFGKMMDKYGLLYIFHHLSMLISKKLFEARLHESTKVKITSFLIYYVRDLFSKSSGVAYQIQHKSYDVFHTLNSLFEREIVSVGQNEQAAFKLLEQKCMFKVPIPPKRNII